MTDVATRPNVDLLRRTLAYIEEHPEEWNQSRYTPESEGCGTAMCFAGHAAITLGGGVWIGSYDAVKAEADDPRSEVREADDGTRYTFASMRARRLLGLSHPQADRLFSMHNDLPTLRRLVQEFCEAGS